ncbi:hypothetical protein DWF04_005870 [Cereibacter sphaeroides f. sp. denitrificans]|nr:hypothetical protein DWF04_06315 [Cereibacter sphaeroides f. sp. denitrificans]
MTEIDMSTEAIERLAETLLFRGHHHQEKINHLLRRLHVERITASKTLRALAAERDAAVRERDGLRHCGRQVIAERDALRAEVTKLEGERIDLIAERDEWRGLVASANHERDAALSDAKEAEQIPSLVAIIERAHEATATARAETGALIERAAADFEQDSNLSRSICCNGDMCGCRGASNGEYAAHQLRALTPADATAALAEVRRAERAAGKAEGMRRAIFEFCGDTEPTGSLQETCERVESIAAEIEKGDGE